MMGTQRFNRQLGKVIPTYNSTEIVSLTGVPGSIIYCSDTNAIYYWDKPSNSWKALQDFDYDNLIYVDPDITDNNPELHTYKDFHTAYSTEGRSKIYVLETGKDAIDLNTDVIDTVSDIIIIGYGNVINVFGSLPLQLSYVYNFSGTSWKPGVDIYIDNCHGKIRIYGPEQPNKNVIIENASTGFVLDYYTNPTSSEQIQHLYLRKGHITIEYFKSDDVIIGYEGSDEFNNNELDLYINAQNIDAANIHIYSSVANIHIDKYTIIPALYSQYDQGMLDIEPNSNTAKYISLSIDKFIVDSGSTNNNYHTIIRFKNTTSRASQEYWLNKFIIRAFDFTRYTTSYGFTTNSPYHVKFMSSFFNTGSGSNAGTDFPDDSGYSTAYFVKILDGFIDFGNWNTNPLTKDFLQIQSQNTAWPRAWNWSVLHVAFKDSNVELLNFEAYIKLTGNTNADGNFTAINPHIPALIYSINNSTLQFRTISYNISNYSNIAQGTTGYLNIYMFGWLNSLCINSGTLIINNLYFNGYNVDTGNYGYLTDIIVNFGRPYVSKVDIYSTLINVNKDTTSGNPLSHFTFRFNGTGSEITFYKIFTKYGDGNLTHANFNDNITFYTGVNEFIGNIFTVHFIENVINLELNGSNNKFMIFGDWVHERLVKDITFVNNSFNNVLTNSTWKGTLTDNGVSNRIELDTNIGIGSSGFFHKTCNKDINVGAASGWQGFSVYNDCSIRILEERVFTLKTKIYGNSEDLGNVGTESSKLYAEISITFKLTQSGTAPDGIEILSNHVNDYSDSNNFYIDTPSLAFNSYDATNKILNIGMNIPVYVNTDLLNNITIPVKIVNEIYL